MSPLLASAAAAGGAEADPVRFGFISLAYVGASVAFVLGLRGLTKPETARQGMQLAFFGMLAAIAGTTTPSGTLVIGTDCPALTPDLLRQAANALAAHDAAVVPAEDGGYVLIGMRQAAPQVFADVDWSTGRVMAQTRARLAEIGWRWQEFAPLWDVDRGEDLERLNAGFPESMEQAGA